MTTWLLYGVIGTGTGAVYAAIAMGTILTYRGSGVVNFAQGAMATFPALVFLELRQTGDLVLPLVGPLSRIPLGGPMATIPAMLLGLLVAALIGLLADLLIFRHLRGATPLAKVIASVGLSSVLIGLSVLHFGAAPRTGPAILPAETVSVFGRPIPQDRFWLTGLVILTGIVLWLVYKYTIFGLATQAAAANEKGAELLGHSPRRLGTINWVLAAVIAGAAGILVTPVRGVDPFNYSAYLVAALAAALAARLKSFGLAIAAGIGVGMFSGLAVHLVSTDQVPDFLRGGFDSIVPFVVIVGALALFGTNLPGRGEVMTERNPFAPMPKFNWAVIGTALVAVVLVLGFAEASLRLATIESLIQTVLVLSIVLLAGYVGQVTLAELTFAGFAAFVLAKFAGESGLPFPLSPLLAIAVTTIVATAISVPAVRIRGIQLAIVTVAAATAIEEVLFRSPDFTGPGGMSSVPRPKLFGINLGILPEGRGGYPNHAFGFFVLAIAIACAVMVVNIRRSAIGRRMLAVRANERAAAASGINVPRTKLVGAAMGSFLASTAGVLMAYKFVDFSNAGFEASRGLAVVALAYIGGIATVAGAFVAGILAPAGILFTLLGATSSTGQMLFSGVGLILVAIKFPGGIASVRDPARRWWERGAKRVVAAPAAKPHDELEIWMQPEPADG